MEVTLLKDKLIVAVFLIFVIIISFTFLNDLYIRRVFAQDLITTDALENETEIINEVSDNADLALYIDVNKSTVGEGESLIYTFTVKNIGTDLVENVSVNDITIPEIKLTKNANDSDDLHPGKTCTFTSEYTILSTSDDGYFINEAVAVGEKNGVSTTSEKSQAKVLVSNKKTELTVNKSVNRAKAIIGDLLEYTIIVTNTGETVLNGINVVDTQKSGSITFINNGSTNDLKPQESVIFIGNYIVNQIDIEDNKIINIAKISAVSDNGEEITIFSNEAVTTIINSSLKLKKTVNNEFPLPGETITFNYTVTNISINPIKDVKIKDDLFNSNILSPKSVDSLLPGQTVVFTANYMVPKDLIPGHVIQSDATCVGKDENNNNVTSDVSSIICTIAESKKDEKPLASVSKVIDNDKPYKGDTVKYTIIINNIGNTLLENVVVEDKQLGYVNTIERLDVGQTFTIDLTKKVTEDVGETFTNTVEVSSNALQKVSASVSYNVYELEATTNDTQSPNSTASVPIKEMLPNAGENIGNKIFSFFETLINKLTSLFK